MKPNPCIIELKKIKQLMKGQKQEAFYDWILSKGKSYNSHKLTKNEEIALSKVSNMGLYRPKMCFYTAQMIALSSDFHYCEGYAQIKSIGLNLEHGWLVKDGKIFDPTWKNGTFYFGVKVPLRFIRKNIIETGMAESLLIKFFIEKEKSEKRR